MSGPTQRDGPWSPGAAHRQIEVLAPGVLLDAEDGLRPPEWTQQQLRV
jgi:hypothetical protein